MPDPNTGDGNLIIAVKHSLGNFSDADMCIWDFAGKYAHGSLTLDMPATSQAVASSNKITGRD